MKKIYSLFLVTTLLLAAITVGCKNTDVDQEVAISVSQAASPAEGFEATSATFNISGSGIESFAYKLHKGDFNGSTDGAVIYADAAEVVPMDGAQCTYIIYGLDGASEYTAEFAFKIAGANKYEVKSVKFLTEEYSDKLLHIISAEQFSLKFVIDMPEGVKYRYSLVDRSSYEMNRMQYAWDDMSHLRYGVKADGRKVVELHDGDILGQDPDGYDIVQLIKPGMSFVLLVSECDDNYTPLYEQVDYGEVEPSGTASATRADAPNVGNYTEECSDGNIKITGLYAKQYFTTKQPYPAQGDVEAEIKTTERTATITFNPSPEVVRYGYAVWIDGEIDKLKEIIGEDGLLTALQSDFVPATEASQIQIGIEKGVNYSLEIIYFSDENETTRSLKSIPFTATESSKPVPVIEVTPLPNAVTEDGELNPYAVAFNIKAPNKDCKRIKLAIDYTRNFITEANAGGGTREDNIKDIVLNYGLEITAADDMEIFEGINSDEGFYVDFDSFEDTQNLLAVVSLNDDDKAYLSWCNSRSACEPAKEPLSTPEFEKLDGEWTATYKYNSDWDEVGAPVRENKFKAVITSDPGFDAPESFGSGDAKYDKIHEFYVGRGTLMGEANPESYATEQIAKDFAEFKRLAVRFKEKYASQNRKVIYGFKLDSDIGMENHTPWELFCDLNYTSYDVEQLFYDYGPKMFIDVLLDQDGNKVIRMVNNQAIVAPLFSYYGSTYTAAGMSLTAWEDFDYESQTGITAGTEGLPLVCVDDDNIYLGSITDDKGNNDYYLSTFQYIMGAEMIVTIGKDNLYMTRGYSEPAAAPTVKSEVQNRTNFKVPYRVGNHFKRMYMPNN